MRRRSRATLALELAACVSALALLSPLVLYAGTGSMPLLALVGVAGGIALSLGVVGRRLHRLLLADALRRGGREQAVLALGLMLVVTVLAFFAIGVCVLLVLRTAVAGA